MTKGDARVRVSHITTENPIRVLVLDEFRLRAEDIDGAAARIVADTPHGIEPVIPLLTSIEDRRDVATLRALHAGESTEFGARQRAALDPLVSSWAAPKQYGPRIAKRSQSPPLSFRLAVTESGINTRDGQVLRVPERSVEEEEPSRRAIGLLWIGTPLGHAAGLLVLLGGYDDDPRAAGDHSFAWPLALSNELGVRIYENSRS